MSTSNSPPRLASALLRVSCPAERLEEIEGDLFELFAQRCERVGVKQARRRYALDVCGICLRQLSTRTQRTIHIYPLRVLSALLVGIVVLIPFAFEHAWARHLQFIVGCAYGTLEVCIYTAATLGIFKSFASMRRRRRGPVLPTHDE